MLTTLPLECFVCREVMTEFWFPSEPWHPSRHLIFTTTLVVSAMALALLTCDLGAVFELIGATSASALAFILPPLCYLKLSTRTWKIWLAAGSCACFGFAVMGISLVQAVWKIITSTYALLQMTLTGQRDSRQVPTQIKTAHRRAAEFVGQPNVKLHLRDPRQRLLHATDGVQIGTARGPILAPAHGCRAEYTCLCLAPTQARTGDSPRVHLPIGIPAPVRWRRRGKGCAKATGS